MSGRRAYRHLSRQVHKSLLLFIPNPDPKPDPVSFRPSQTPWHETRRHLTDFRDLLLVSRMQYTQLRRSEQKSAAIKSPAPTASASTSSPSPTSTPQPLPYLNGSHDYPSFGLPVNGHHPPEAELGLGLALGSSEEDPVSPPVTKAKVKKAKKKAGEEPVSFGDLRENFHHLSEMDTYRLRLHFKASGKILFEVPEAPVDELMEVFQRYGKVSESPRELGGSRDRPVVVTLSPALLLTPSPTPILTLSWVLDFPPTCNVTS